MSEGRGDLAAPVPLMISRPYGLNLTVSDGTSEM
jgi:hypothetical protein